MRWRRKAGNPTPSWARSSAVEHLTFNQRVVGSIPTGLTIPSCQVAASPRWRRRGGLLAAALAAGLLAPVCAAHADGDARLMDALVGAYPDFIAGHEGNDILWKDGSRTPFDDGKPQKSFAQRLDAPSLKDMFYAPYPAAMPTQRPAVDVDPGRVRNQAFFLKMYGDCRRGAVARSLVEVVWLPKKWGKTLRVTSINGVAERLKEVSDELDRLPAAFDKFLLPPAGGYNCRNIAGTGRLSAHGTASAVDLATRYSRYWRWHGGRSAKGEKHLYDMPAEIVSAFERHGFIWGGKWHHYDTMHFEYRPEILAAQKR